VNLRAAVEDVMCGVSSVDRGRGCSFGALAGDYARGKKLGVGDGIRTRDVQIHSLALYQLSYTHRSRAS
jgi:hypothetical protein